MLLAFTQGGERPGDEYIAQGRLLTQEHSAGLRGFREN